MRPGVSFRIRVLLRVAALCFNTVFPRGAHTPGVSGPRPPGLPLATSQRAGGFASFATRSAYRGSDLRLARSSSLSSWALVSQPVDATSERRGKGAALRRARARGRGGGGGARGAALPPSHTFFCAV